MSINRSIVISLWFNGSLNQDKAIVFFTELFKEKSKKIFTELHYTITDKTKFYWKQKTKGGKYNIKALEKFRDAISQGNDKIIIDFELLTNLPNCEYKSRDIDISVTYSQVEEIKSINITLDSDQNKTIDIKEITKSICNFILEEDCNILYGLAFEMESQKMPSFFIQGIKTENLSKKEEDKLFLWSNNKSRCDEKIWDIFWGNIISTKHITNNQTFKDIEKIVGKENALSLTPNLIWFNLNTPLVEFDILKYSSQRKQLYEYFKTKQLLLSSY